MSEIDPLAPDAVTIRAVQFVGTNVEMTYLVDAGHDPGHDTGHDAEARLEALLRAKLGLFACTATGTEDGPDGCERQRFSVIASPLDRLFHKIGPSLPLTLIKHASITLDLSEVNLTRQAQGLARVHPGISEAGTASEAEVWPAWDVGKLLGTLLRRPALLEHGPVRVAGVEVEAGRFPDAVLAGLPAHVEAHGGVRVDLPDALRIGLAG